MENTANADPFGAATDSSAPGPSRSDRITARANDMLRLAIIEELHATPSVSLTEFFSEADIKPGSMEWIMIMDTPLDELVHTPIEAMNAAPAARGWAKATAKAPAKARRAQRAPGAARDKASKIEDLVLKYISDAEKGHEFKTRSFTEWAGVTQQRALRALAACPLIKKQGEKRFMVWVVK